MTIHVAFKFLKNVVCREARNQKRVPQVRSTREETLRIELMVTSSYFNSKT